MILSMMKLFKKRNRKFLKNVLKVELLFCKKLLENKRTEDLKMHLNYMIGKYVIADEQ